ncbi:uncharacterized protein N7496_006237 [Penicillium cataractarum]|uniref:Uncharacterized protein n=1 Tax=Penicillium cataractarum TaxID=2100454 RepID=A0A9W9S1E9_9EURO|nr:uncharacterized protein N7496_006237 [Penicillium cataractarum]KAJ5370145.1 hypothetical protein N7496_006237 [Penicillium cataractarum]
MSTGPRITTDGLLFQCFHFRSILDPPWRAPKDPHPTDAPDLLGFWGGVHLHRAHSRVGLALQSKLHLSDVSDP